MIFDIYNILFSYIFCVFVIRKAFSSKQKLIKWSYNDCNIYINYLDIICTNYSGNLNGTNICQDWTIFNQSNIIYLPEECAHKTYSIASTNNSTKMIQNNFNITITNNYIYPKKYTTNDNKYNRVKKCMKVYTTIVKECTLEEDIENCKKVKQKLNISDFCINLILDIIEEFQNKVESLLNINENNQSESKIFQEVNMVLPGKISKEKKEVSKFQNLEHLNGKTLNIINDNKPKKDCVEYGLKSISEEILVCLKYE